MPEFTFLVGISSEGENREAAELALLGVLVPLLKSRDSSSPIESWWIAEDERQDGSDLDSAIFVPMGRQAAARRVLEAAQLDAEPEGPRPPRDLDWSDVEADAARMMEALAPWVVETTYNTDPEGKPVEEWDDSNRTLHGPFPSEEAAEHFMNEVWPDGDTDVRDQVAFQLNDPDSLTGEATRRCLVCQHRVALADPEDPESWVHAEDGEWGDHTAEVQP